MDKFFSFLAFPIGLAICFSPLLVAWAMAERESARKADRRDKPE